MQKWNDLGMGAAILEAEPCSEANHGQRQPRGLGELISLHLGHPFWAACAVSVQKQGIWNSIDTVPDNFMEKWLAVAGISDLTLLITVFLLYMVGLVVNNIL